MRKLRSLGPGIAAAILFASSFLFRPLPASSVPSEGPLKGIVTAVYDGDTIKVRLSGRADQRVRLIGVDSPELDDARERVRVMAFLAKRFTFSRLYQAKVELQLGPEKWDNFGRLLAIVKLAGGETFNGTLVREGYAFAYFRFPFDETLKKELKAAETEARQAGRGLWRREPYPAIDAAEAQGRVGEIVSVRFRCLRSFKRGDFRILEADGEAFDAAVPLEVYKTLPGSLDFEGLTLEATGLVELYKGRPQVVIGLPVQLKRIDGKDRP